MTALALNFLDGGRWARLALSLLALLVLFAFAGQFAGKAWAQTTPPTTEAPKDKPAEPAKPPETKPEEKKKPAVLNSGDTAWMLAATALVLLMTIPGVALFYGGMVRKKNVLDTVMQSFMVTCLVTVLYTIAKLSACRSSSTLPRR